MYEFDVFQLTREKFAASLTSFNDMLTTLSSLPLSLATIRITSDVSSTSNEIFAPDEGHDKNRRR